MKKIALSLGCLAMVLGVPAVSLAQETAPAPEASQPAQDAAVRSYMLRAVACMMDNAAAQMENMQAEPVAAFVKTFEDMHKAVAAISVDGLPERYQAYVRESNEINRDFVEQCKPLIPADGSEPSDDVKMELQAIQLENQVLMEQLEEKYPEVAAVMGQEALRHFMDRISEELSLKARAATWAEEHSAELEAQGPLGMASVLRYLASELRKEADAK